MAANFGAHEAVEVHEVLTVTIDGINQFQLYREHVKDPQLLSILDKQTNFAFQQYNNFVQAINQQGMAQSVPYRAPQQAAPVYGLRNPGPQAPNTSANEIDDRDVASGMLGWHKASASMRMIAALECANPQVRHLIQAGANDCAEQAYEVWQYMNHKGYYQVPTMMEKTTGTVLGGYMPTQMPTQMAHTPIS